MQGVVNSPVFWSFVQGTMPTMGNGRHVLRRGPLVQFFVVLSKHSIQSEIAGRVRQLMETESAEEAWFSRRIPSTFSPKGSFLKKIGATENRQLRVFVRNHRCALGLDVSLPP